MIGILTDINKKKFCMWAKKVKKLQTENYLSHSDEVVKSVISNTSSS